MDAYDVMNIKTEPDIEISSFSPPPMFPDEPQDMDNDVAQNIIMDLKIKAETFLQNQSYQQLQMQQQQLQQYQQQQLQQQARLNHQYIMQQQQKLIQQHLQQQQQ